MVQLNGLKHRSSQLMAVALAVVLFIVGTSFVVGQTAFDLARAVVLIILGIILLLEIGVKKFTPLSNLKTLGFLQYLTMSIAAVLLLGGLLALPFVPLGTPLWILTLTDLAVVAGTLALVAEAFA